MQRQEVFAERLMEAIDSIELDQTLSYLDSLRASNHEDRNPYARYFLAIDLVLKFGAAPISVPQMTRLQAHFQRLVEHSLPNMAETLPDYPGLGVAGVNILHVVAMYTVNDPVKAEAFFTALKRAKLATKENLSARCALAAATPLHLAAESGTKQMIEMILGMDRKQLAVTNAHGQTASDIAASSGLSSLATFLADKETEQIRKRQLREAASSITAESPPTDEAPRTAVTNMMEMLKGYQTSSVVAPEELPAPKRQKVDVPPLPKRLATIASPPGVAPMGLGANAVMKHAPTGVAPNSAVMKHAPSSMGSNNAVTKNASPRKGSAVTKQAATAVTGGMQLPAPREVPSNPVIQQAASGDNPVLNYAMSFIARSQQRNSQLPSPSSSGDVDTVNPATEDAMDRQKSVELELKNLTDFVAMICALVPGGKLMTDSYCNFLMRIGITRLSALNEALANPGMAAKLPSWMKLAIESNIGVALASFP